jgi:ABC-type polar amino acid transport system ATPase subunit
MPGVPATSEVEGSETGTGEPILRVRDVHLNRGDRRILDGVSLEAHRGELVAIMGPSGSGKTTLLRAIAGLEPFQAGHIALDDVRLEHGPSPTQVRRALCRKVGMVFQFHCLFEHLSALDNVCLAPVHAYGMAAQDAERRAHDLLRAFGVDHRAAALPPNLSGGEAQRVAIARALAVDPPLLLMDEPTASLDRERRAELGELMRSLIADGRTLVIATHDEEFARAWATDRLRVEHGKLSRTS